MGVAAVRGGVDPLRLAAIDIGTNTVRLIVVDAGQGGWRAVFSDRKITRLGERLAAGGKLWPAAAERTMRVVADYARLAGSFGADKLRCAATSAVREARDGPEFAAMIEAQTGLKVEILDARQEAALTLMGVARGMGGLAGPSVLIDVGGGSAELIRSEGQRPVGIATTDLGAVRLTERFLICDPVAPDELIALETYAEAALRQALESLDPPADPRFIGTAGTITTLSAVKQGLEVYSTEAINNSILSYGDVRRMLDRFLAMSAAERADIAGLEKGREDIIVAGASVVKKTFEILGVSEMVVSDFGLREGLVASLEGF